MPASQSPAITPDQFSSFGELLKFLRRRAGLSQSELSIAVGYSKSQISRLERNERAPDAAALTARFVEALGLEKEKEWTARLLELSTERETASEDSPSPTATHNLPNPLTSFVGRGKEIAEIKQLFDSTRLLTLTGAGGSGKTRLALQACREMESESLYANGVRWVELAPLTDPALVPHAIAKALDLHEHRGLTLTETLLDVLHDKSMLLVLDNCEHLVEECAALALQLLKQCPNLCILTTSREMLNIEGEQVWVVPSLSLTTDTTLDLSGSDAARLFIERASALQTDFHIDNRNAVYVAQICRRLDGIPLALELAAARIKVLSVEQIAERLDDAMRLLSAGKRAAPERHQTLQATMDWSYALLSPPEQVLFRRLAVFAAGFTIEAAEAICSDYRIAATDVLPVLTNLVNKSLVIKEEKNGAARCRLLEPIRQYASQMLIEADEDQTIGNRHLKFFLCLTEQAAPELNGAEQTAWLNRLEREHDNLRAAIGWARARGMVEEEMRLALAMRWFWEWLGYWTEAREILTRALAQLDFLNETPARSRLRERGLLALGSFMHESVGQQAAKQLFDQALTLAESLADAQTTAEALLYKAIGSFDSGDYTPGQMHIEACLALCRGIGDAHLTAWALSQRGYYTLIYGNLNQASADLEESLRQYRSINHQFGIAAILSVKSLVTFHQGDYAATRALNAESLSIAQETGDKRQSAIALQRLGQAYASEGEYAMAEAIYNQNVVLRGEMQSRTSFGHILILMSNLKRLTGDDVAAQTLAEDGLCRAREANYRLAEAHGLAALGRLALAQGHYSQARTYLEECLRIRQQIHNKLDMPAILLDLADLEFCQSNFERAKNLYEQTLAISYQIGSEAKIPIALRMLGYIALYDGDFKSALQKVTEGLKLVQQKNFRLGAICQLPAFAALNHAQGDARSAALVLAGAEALVQAMGVRLEPADAMAYQRILSAVRSQLDRETFDRASNEGRMLTLEQIIEYTLGQFNSELEAPGLEPSRTSPPGLLGLTPREREIAVLVSQGKTNREIAAQLVLSERTVENHIGNILSKLDFHSRTQIAGWALEQRLPKHPT